MNIAMHIITNSATRLNMCDLFGNDLLLNSKNKRENGGPNKGNDNILSEKKLIIMGTNLQPKTLDPPIPINPNLDSTLPNSYITATHLTLYRLEPKKARPNVNRKPNISSHTPTTNDLDLFSHNSINSSCIYK